MFRFIANIVFGLVVVIVSPVQAVLLESFEKGLDGWSNFSQSEYGAVTVNNFVDRHDTVYLPTEGGSFLRLQAGTPNGLPVEQDLQTRIVSQAIMVNPGDRIVFDTAWIGNDALPYNDSAMMGYRLDGMPLMSFVWSIEVSGDNYSIPWQVVDFFFALDEASLVWLEFFVRNDRDSGNPSFLLIDNIRHEKASSVPEPASILLLMSSLGLLAARQGRR